MIETIAIVLCGLFLLSYTISLLASDSMTHPIMVISLASLLGLIGYRLLW